MDQGDSCRPSHMPKPAPTGTGWNLSVLWLRCGFLSLPARAAAPYAPAAHPCGKAKARPRPTLAVL